MGKWIDFGSTKHCCRTPGWRERRRVKIRSNAIWQCDCGKYWQWVWDGYDGGYYWIRVYRRKDGTINRIPDPPEGPSPIGID